MGKSINPWPALLAIITTILFFALLAIGGPARADCRQFFVRHHAVAVVAPVIAVPHVVYQAGVGIEQDALAAKVAKLVIGQIRAELKAPQQQRATSTSAIAQHCGKCHSGAQPKANTVYDGVTSLDCWQVTAALRAIRDGTMPKDHKIAPEVMGQLMEELLNLEQPADRSPRVEVPPPEPTGELK